MDSLITSPDNPRLKLIRKLLSSSTDRKKTNQCVIESPLFIRDIARNHPDWITFIVQIETLNFSTTAPTFFAPETLLKTMATGVFQGAFAVITRPNIPIEWNKNTLFLLYLDQLQNPANVGAILRNAAAFDLDGILIGKGTVDPFHPDSIRASAGTCLSLPIEDANVDLMPKNIHWYALSPTAKTPLESLSITGSCGFILGAEGPGLSDSTIKQLSAKPIRITQSPKIDSLNVAVSSGIVLHHLYQKNF